MYSKLDKELVDSVWNSGDLAFSHGCGISPETVASHPELDNIIRVTGTTIARHGKEFVSQYEYKDYPFYATQYHIEKTVFERNRTNRHINRNPKLIKFAFEFMMEFVREARPYAKPRAEIDSKIVARFFEHHRPEKGVFSFFEQVYQFRRFVKDDYIKSTFRDQIKEYWRLKKAGITMNAPEDV
jgi:gamma-glutamyl hydrolase